MKVINMYNGDNFSKFNENFIFLLKLAKDDCNNEYVFTTTHHGWLADLMSNFKNKGFHFKRNPKNKDMYAVRFNA